MLDRPAWEPTWLLKFSNDTAECTKGDLTRPSAIVMQLVLGALAFSILILKRYLEPSETSRAWLVWVLDTSKQGINMLAMHILNILLAELGSQEQMDDPCTYYIASFLLDTSIGLVIIWAGLKLFELPIVYFKILGGHKFGEYATEDYERLEPDETASVYSIRNPPFSIPAWIMQTFCYLLVTVFEKFSTYEILGVDGLVGIFKDFRVFLTAWINNRDVEVALTLFVIPLILNCFMFWMVDNILMKAISRYRENRDDGAGEQDETLVEECGDDGSPEEEELLRA